MTFEPEFKKALQNLPSAEKDKLILRLLKHDLKLANKLLFELVDTETIEQKREKLEQKIIKEVKFATEKYYSPGYLLMDMRYMSGDINEHVAITKDKYGEISLNCLMLKNTLELNSHIIKITKPNYSFTLCNYIIARIFKILLLIQKQHEDYHIEFSNDIEAIGNLVLDNPPLMKMAINNGLDVNWLIKFEIPKNIANIHKDLKTKGFLR